MKISSLAFEDQQFIPSLYSCLGENINPPLNFSSIPDNSKSLVLIVDDPDAPNGTFTHWLVWNIKPENMKVDENDCPSGGVEGMNGVKKLGYMGPCPPSGVHHYHFKLYALSSTIDVSQNISREELESVINPLIIEKAELVGLFSKDGS